MALEPLGSIMSMQAQNAPQNNVQKTERVDTEVARPKTQPEENSVDVATVAVANVGESQEADAATTYEQNSEASEEQIRQQNERIKKAVEQLNRNIGNSEAVFGIHEGTNRVTIKLVDKESKKVIKELPPEKTLDMIAKVWEMAGLMVDERR